LSESNETVVTDRDFWVMGAAFLMLALAVGGLIANLVVLSSQAHKADLTYTAACSYYHNLQLQLASSTRYLRAHPDGAPALGISAQQIQQSINREQAAVDSLASLDCPK